MQINTAATLTVTNALAVGANTVKLDAAGVRLTDTNGITLAGGTISGLGTIAANTNVTGSGTVSISIANAGTLTASNGTLDLTVTASGRTLAISNATASVLIRFPARRPTGGDLDHDQQSPTRRWRSDLSGRTRSAKCADRPG